ncbi:hypothetical protein IPH70_03520 [Candidatus Roizmanbacteria bacterium]|nr:MAG: hypothetical protein IPH70_03520 [Candidatus Roizmanbacteria bacterium]
MAFLSNLTSIGRKKSKRLGRGYGSGKEQNLPEESQDTRKRESIRHFILRRSGSIGQKISFTSWKR